MLRHLASAVALGCCLGVPAAGAGQGADAAQGSDAAPGADAARDAGVRWRLEAEPFYGTAAALWPAGGGWNVGPQVGAGVHEPLTLGPEGADFSSLAHVGVVASRPLHGNASLDAELRLGLGDRLAVCPASDCLPTAYGALLVGGAVGWPRVRIGTRGGVARVRGEAVAVWSPVYIRLRL